MSGSGPLLVQQGTEPALQVFLQYQSHFSLLCPSSPARPPCTAGYNVAPGNGGSTHSCSGLKVEQEPEKGVASLSGECGRLTQPPAAAEAILDSGTTESKGSPTPGITSLRVKPEVFSNNEIQPQIHSPQHADKLFMFKITSLRNMKPVLDFHLLHWAASQPGDS